ncbi:MAG: hypothetical protein AAGJ52_02925 [Pseudomonadota bacterium]
MSSIGVDGQVACVGIPDGDITGIIDGVGIEGGCFSGDCTLTVDTVVIQARVSGLCGSNQAIRAISQSGAVTCVNVPGDDITGITTTSQSRLSGRCTTGTCSLSVDPTDFNSSNPVGSASTLSAVSTLSGSNLWRPLGQFTLGATNRTGELLLMANADVTCLGCPTPSGTITCKMGFSRSPSGELETSGNSRTIVGFDDNTFRTDNMANVEELSASGGSVLTVYLVGRSAAGISGRQCLFDNIKIGGIFAPN